jgi:hypothetical protein
MISSYNATASNPANAAARPISSLPAAPVDSETRPVDVPDAPPAPVAEGLKVVGTVALPDGWRMMLPLTVADALLPDAVAEAVAEADPDDLGTSVAGCSCQQLVFNCIAPLLCNHFAPFDAIST